jgi:hypothetical protein
MKLRALPLGPKWQFKSTAYHGEPKGAVKARLEAAGAGRARANFFEMPARERSLYVAMLVKSSDKSWYAPAKGLRRRIEKQVCVCVCVCVCA